MSIEIRFPIEDEINRFHSTVNSKIPNDLSPEYLVIYKMLNEPETRIVTIRLQNTVAKLQAVQERDRLVITFIEAGIPIGSCIINDEEIQTAFLIIGLHH